MSATKTASINSRIEEDVKSQAEAILSRLGISRATAIEMYYRQIILNNGIPFSLTVPPAVPVRSNMSNDDFNHMMSAGYKQAVKDESYDLDEVFQDQAKQLNEMEKGN